MKRTITAWLRVVGLSAALVAPAYAQDYYPDYNYAPGPQLATEKLFAPLDISPYGSGPDKNEGFFATYDFVWLSMPAPDSSTVGVPVVGNTSLQFVSSINDGIFEAQWNDSNRLEFGYINDNKGWLGSYWDLGGSNQFFVIGQPTVVFSLPSGGAFMQEFDHIKVESITDGVSGEIMRMWRCPEARPRQPFQPTLEFMFGVRYMQINDQYNVEGERGTGNILDPIADEDWYTSTENNLVGPQVAVRYARQNGPFEWNCQAKFCAAANFAEARNRTYLSRDLLDDVLNNANAAAPAGSSTRIDQTEFVPIGEFRIQASYLVTQKVAIQGGWQCIYLGDGIMRPNQVQSYPISNEFVRQGPNGLIENKQDMFMHGFNIGVVINR